MNTLYQDRETFKKDRKELQQTMGKKLSEMKDYMGRELACFKVERQREREERERDPNNTDEVSLYPANAPKDPPPHQHLRAKPQQHTSGTHQIITPQQQPKGRETPATPETQKPLRTPLLQPQLRNSQ